MAVTGDLGNLSAICCARAASQRSQNTTHQQQISTGHWGLCLVSPALLGPAFHHAAAGLPARCCAGHRDLLGQSGGAAHVDEVRYVRARGLHCGYGVREATSRRGARSLPLLAGRPERARSPAAVRRARLLRRAAPSEPRPRRGKAGGFAEPRRRAAQRLTPAPCLSCSQRGRRGQVADSGVPRPPWGGAPHHEQ